MTDKQIIHEVDVSKCEFCEGSGYCYIYSGTADFRWMCEENEDCQIKNLLLQLKAKEQEVDVLKAENEELTNQVDYLRREYKEIKWTNEAISRQCQNINCKDLQKLKQTLAEIKEIIHFNKTNRLSGGACISIEQILNKISEVEDDNA